MLLLLIALFRRYYIPGISAFQTAGYFCCGRTDDDDSSSHACMSYKWYSYVLAAHDGKLQGCSSLMLLVPTNPKPVLGCY
ncbi:hypothetical protein V8C43DRAFT_276975 [Trichoderma afarasin]